MLEPMCEDMDDLNSPVFHGLINGLGGVNGLDGVNGLGGVSQEALDDLIEGLDWKDFLTSPGPNSTASGFEQYMETDASQMDAQQMDQPQGIVSSTTSPPAFGGNPMLNAYNPPPTPLNDLQRAMGGAQHMPTPHGIPPTFANPVESDVRMPSYGIEDIEPSMRIDSTEVRVVMADRLLVEERLRSIELQPTNDNSGQHQVVPDRGVALSRRPNDPAESDSGTTSHAPLHAHDSPDSSTRKAGFMEDYKLPPYHHFKVTVQFMSTKMLEEAVTDPNGCLLHYQRPEGAVSQYTDKQSIQISTSVKTEQEDGTVVTKEYQWLRDKQKKFTEMILNSFERGVELTSREGNIYATRRSNTKLFWSNTQCTQGHASELSRGIETLVFRWKDFERNLKENYALGKGKELDLPAIWFSFAQKWETSSCTITTKLVWARVDPSRAREMIKGINPDVRHTSYVESLHTSNFGISTE